MSWISFDVVTIFFWVIIDGFKNISLTLRTKGQFEEVASVTIIGINSSGVLTPRTFWGNSRSFGSTF